MLGDVAYGDQGSFSRPCIFLVGELLLQDVYGSRRILSVTALLLHVD